MRKKMKRSSLRWWFEISIRSFCALAFCQMALINFIASRQRTKGSKIQFLWTEKNFNLLTIRTFFFAIYYRIECFWPFLSLSRWPFIARYCMTYFRTGKKTFSSPHKTLWLNATIKIESFINLFWFLTQLFLRDDFSMGISAMRLRKRLENTKLNYAKFFLWKA